MRLTSPSLTLAKLIRGGSGTTNPDPCFGGWGAPFCADGSCGEAFVCCGYSNSASGLPHTKQRRVQSTDRKRPEKKNRKTTERHRKSPNENVRGGRGTSTSLVPRFRAEISLARARKWARRSYPSPTPPPHPCPIALSLLFYFRMSRCVRVCVFGCVHSGGTRIIIRVAQCDESKRPWNTADSLIYSCVCV